jgi:signal transduction histidine kinase
VSSIQTPLINDQLYTLVNALPTPIIVFDKEFKPFFCNTAYTDFSKLHESDYFDKLQKQLKEISMEEGSFTIENETRNSFRCTFHTQHINNDLVIIVSIDTNETSFSHLQELRDGFLRTVSHELRTPLTTVMGFIEIVYFNKETPLTLQQKTYLKTALTEAQSLKTLIDDLLDITILRSKKTKASLAPIRISSFLTKLLTTLSPLKNEKAILLTHSIYDDELIINADKKKLRRIFINLITNAMKFTDEGTINIDLKEQSSEFLFSVNDTGIGIRDQDKEMIFEEFSQTDYSTTRKFEGIGLGLTIVKQLVELHKGKIWVESTLGEGASFFFTIPKSI